MYKRQLLCTISKLPQSSPVLLCLREFVELPSSWPPARVGGGVGAAVHDTASAGKWWKVVDPVNPVPCRKVVFRLYETLTFESRVLTMIVTLRRF